MEPSLVEVAGEGEDGGKGTGQLQMALKAELGGTNASRFDFG